MSSTGITSRLVAALLLAAAAAALHPQVSACSPSPGLQNSTPHHASGGEVAVHPAQLFQHGQDALTRGQLDEAERAFRRVLALDSQAAGAYANLGVVYMRRKQWAKALEMLNKAEHLMPQVPGIRLNIGLTYYRQSEFLKAIPPFESVLRDQPGSTQARHLLGQCYFFVERWADAVQTLEPLWPQASTQLDYLYVLTIAANRAGRKDLDEKAFSQLVQVGGDSPELHLFMGKAHLNLEQYDMALSEFQSAAQVNPRLPFVHFNLGLTYLKKQDYEHARDEFLKDAAIEPDLALDYEQLGDVYSLMRQDTEAEKNYREAVKRDSRLVNSYVGLAKVCQRQEKFQQALIAIDSASKVEPGRTDTHYLRGQILVHLGRKEEGKKELETAIRMDNERRAEREKQLERAVVPSPELMQEPQ